MNLHGIRFRLLLCVATVVAVSLLTVGFIIRGVTRTEFGQYVQTIETEMVTEAIPPASQPDSFHRFASKLQEHIRTGAEEYDLAATFEKYRQLLKDSQALLVGTQGQFLAATIADFADVEVTLLPDRGIELDLEIARSPQDRERRTLTFRGRYRTLTNLHEEAVAYLYQLPPSFDIRKSATQTASSPEQVFLSSFDRWMLAVVAFIGTAALVVTFILTHRIVEPLERLTHAARKLESGVRNQKVDIRRRDEIGALAQAFNSMTASLERMEELRRNMLSDISHELRTPLTRLRAQIEGVQDDILELSPQLMHSLHEEVLLLNRLVDDLRDLTLAEAGQLRLNPEAVELSTELHRAAHLPGWQEGATIDITATPGLWIRADRLRFRQILENLLSNAIRHAPQDDRIRLDAARLSETAPEQIHISVSDSGPGIEDKHMANIFERFYRTDPSRQRPTGGVGLGLAIVKHLVELQGGQVWVESQSGKGSKFSFTLPSCSKKESTGRQP